jgi:3-oxoacyl-[acyl-carrier protein] reductase
VPAAVITGSSRGIGRGTALRFAEDGYDVAVNYHTSADRATEVADAVRERGAEATVVGADVSDPDAAARLVETAADELGGIDHVVNNAGIDQHVPTAELSPADFDRVMEVNVNGAFHVTKAALSHLRDSGDDPSITYVASMLAHTGASIEPHYAASKAALVALARSHAADFAPEIRVNAVSPGHVETDMTDDRTAAEERAARERIPRDRFGQPADVADAIAYLRDAGFVTGETLQVNGGELMW